MPASYEGALIDRATEKKEQKLNTN